MAMTFAERVLARAAWRSSARAGEIVVVRGNERVFPGMTVDADLLEYELP